MLFIYWCVWTSCLDHLFHDDFPIFFIPCFESDIVEINFGVYFFNAKGRIFFLIVVRIVALFLTGISYLTIFQTWISWFFWLVFLYLVWGCVQAWNYNQEEFFNKTDTFSERLKQLLICKSNISWSCSRHLGFFVWSYNTYT